jgi:hypothetical protein
MRTILRAAVAIVGIASVSPALAGDGEGPVANTLFTEYQGVISQVPGQGTPVVMVAGDRDQSAAYETQSSHGTWLFPPHDAGGDNK